MAGLGELLERARLDRGVTLDEAERATHISRRYLQALETEDFSVFAAPVFTRGFLRTYSQYLGLEPADLVALLPDSPDTPEPEPAPEPIYERRARPDTERRPPAGSARPQRRSTFQHTGAAPGPLTRGRLPPASATPAVRVAAITGGLLAAIMVLALAADRVSGHSAPVRNVAGGQQTTSTGVSSNNAAQPKATAAPPARSAGKMPNLVGKDLQTAKQQLQQVGVTPLVIGVVSTSKGDAPGVVLRQEPGTGTALNTNSNVTLIVNQPPAATAPAR